MINSFRVGQKVYLTLDSPGKVGITPGIRPYKDGQFRISKMKALRGVGVTNVKVYYELKGCVSKHGIPYSVTADWMVPAGETK